MDVKSKKMWTFYPQAAVPFAVLAVILLEFFLFYSIFSGNRISTAVIIIIIVLSIILGTYIAIYLWLVGKSRRQKQD
jgi:hypothetical protein